MNDSAEPAVSTHHSRPASRLSTICETPDGPECLVEMADLLGPHPHDLLGLISMCPVSVLHLASVAWAVSRYRRRPADFDHFYFSFVQDAMKNRQQLQLQLLRPAACDSLPGRSFFTRSFLLFSVEPLKSGTRCARKKIPALRWPTRPPKGLVRMDL